jgi:hypothetical protein
MSNLENILNFACDTKRNVHITGAHGTGKTAVVEKVFKEKYGENGYVILNGATVDPYVDVVGLPYAQGSDDNKSLGFLRPAIWAKGKRALFVDEYNRTSPPVRNAVMELSQFGTVNGIKTDIEVVVVANNPADLKDASGKPVYDVSPVDPAQKDRFTIWIETEDGPDKDFFESKYGSEVAKVVLQFWNGLDEKVRVGSGLSPRRMEYAVDAYNDGLEDMGYVIPEVLYPQTFKTAMDGISNISKFRNAAIAGDTKLMSKLVNGPSGKSIIESVTTSETDMIKAVVSVVDVDKFVSLVSSDKKWFRSHSDNSAVVAALKLSPSPLGDEFVECFDRVVQFTDKYFDALVFGVKSAFFVEGSKVGCSPEDRIQWVSFCAKVLDGKTSKSKNLAVLFRGLHELLSEHTDFDQILTNPSSGQICPRFTSEYGECLVLLKASIHSSSGKDSLVKELGSGFDSSPVWELLDSIDK